MMKQVEYEQLAEKFQDHMKNLTSENHKDLKKSMDKVESSKLPEKYIQFNFVKPEPQLTKDQIDQKL